jgi:hypothetical protein
MDPERHRMTKKSVSPAQIEAYDRLIATHARIERKGKNLLYTSVNGHMFTVFSTDAKLGIRLSKEDRAAFLEEHDSELLRSYGAVMREYVTVPDDLLPQTDVLAPWLEASYDYVTSLPPKPTTKTKKKT